MKPWAIGSAALVVAIGVAWLAVRKGPPKPLGRLYVSGEASGIVSAIDLETEKVLAQVPAGKRPRGVHVSPDGKSVYVALSGSPNMGPGLGQHEGASADKAADAIGVIDAEQNTLVRTLPSGSDPEQFAVSADGSRLYIANEDTAQLTVLDPIKGVIVRTVTIGTEPEGVAVTPDGTQVLIASETGNEIDVVDIASGTRVGAIPVGGRPRSVAVSSDGKRAIVTLEDGGAVAVVDLVRRSVLATVKLPGDNQRPMGIALSPDGRTAYVTTGRGKMLFALDSETCTERWSLEVGARPWGVAVSPNGERVYTANGSSNDVSVVDVETHRVASRIPVDGRPWGLAIRP